MNPITPPTTSSVTTNTAAPIRMPCLPLDFFDAGGGGGGGCCTWWGPLNCVGADAGYGAGVLPTCVHGCCGQFCAGAPSAGDGGGGVDREAIDAPVPVTASLAAEAISMVVE